MLSSKNGSSAVLDNNNRNGCPVLQGRGCGRVWPSSQPKLSNIYADGKLGCFFHADGCRISFLVGPDMYSRLFSAYSPKKQRFQPLSRP